MASIREYFPGLKGGVVTFDGTNVADLGDILDANGNEILELDTVASAVNHIRFANAATGTDPVISAQGDNTNVNLGMAFKGDGLLKITSTLTGGQVLVSTNYTDATNKFGVYGTPHYTSSTEEAALGIAGSNSNGQNRVLIGGGFGEFNTATGIEFYTAANHTTTSGTERMRITSGGNVGIGTSTFGTNAATVFAIFNGTAPTTGVADTVQFYSSDNSAGHTIPSFFCEGTEVSATGQADSVSSVRIKMRINGTVVTLLAI